MIEEIIIAADGCRTICGALAHRLAFHHAGEFPEWQCGNNCYFVMHLSNAGQVHMVAGQSTREGAKRYMGDNCVLIDATHAPKSHLEMERNNFAPNP